LAKGRQREKEQRRERETKQQKRQILKAREKNYKQST
jgi:hypothetical protein